MITQDREPINKDARRSLSSGDPSRVKTVEEAMSIAGGIIASPNNIKQVRQMIETGNVVKYQITIKKRPRTPGFIVSMGYWAQSPKKCFLNFADLL